ncbi:TonB-dependent receptor domain-containing protein [Campylobacter suis]|uniref:Heme/hemopexin utilization protein C n=1 Tax=Campylobacter suis TaxID=2790657 RepID=A0ABM8Q6A2_9BACT|nr:TonB-dependent receptor [Campylobacter suis]CAD7288443.1 Heme/hemopexin utilization protein C [Campylobacter suis]
MGFKTIKISLIATLFTSVAFGANDVSLDSIEVSTTGASDVNDIKITTRNAGLVKDVMRDVPGVYVGGTNGMNQKIYMRGVSDRGLNITIDGAKQNGNTFHHNADLLIDPDLIKAVEMEVGAKSVVNGSGALGGSVAFKTVDASDLLEDGQDIGAKLKMGYTSNNEGFSQSAMIYGRAFDSLDLLAAFKHYGYDFGKSGNNKVIGGNGNDINYLFKVGYSFLDAHKISLSTEHMQYKGTYPLKAEFGYDPTVDPKRGVVNGYDNRKYERDTHTIKYTYTPSENFELDSTIYHTKHQRIGSTNTGIKWGVETTGAKIGAKSKFETGDFAHTLRYGFDYYHSENFVKPGNITPEKANNYSLYLEDAIKYSNLTITPGVRYERHELKTYNGQAGNLSGYKYKFDEVSPALALDYNIGWGFSAFASYARVFRGPDVMESMMAAGQVKRGNKITVYNWLANENLKATTGNAYEIGGRYKTEFSENSSLSLVAKYFNTKYKNLIVDNNAKAGVVGCPNGLTDTLCRINAGSATIDGVELFARLYVDDLSLAAGYTHQKVKYHDRTKNGNNYLTSNIIGYRDQGDKYTFNAEYTIPQADLLLGYSLLFFKSKNTTSADDVTGKNIKIPSYAVSDIYATYMPTSGRFKGLEINAGVYNIFDKAYASHSQRTAQYTGDTTSIDWEAGRNFKVNVSYKF